MHQTELSLLCEAPWFRLCKGKGSLFVTVVFPRMFLHANSRIFTKPVNMTSTGLFLYDCNVQPSSLFQEVEYTEQEGEQKGGRGTKGVPLGDLHIINSQYKKRLFNQ